MILYLHQRNEIPFFLCFEYSKPFDYLKKRGGAGGKSRNTLWNVGKSAEESLHPSKIILLSSCCQAEVFFLAVRKCQLPAGVSLSRRVQARRHCSINNTQPNRSQHIPFISSTHFILPPCPPPTDKGEEQGSTTRMKKTPCPFSLRKNPSPTSANPPSLFFLSLHQLSAGSIVAYGAQSLFVTVLSPPLPF